jgi:hypothetical protein
VAPNLNAYAEWFDQTLLVECPEHFPVPGESHLRYLVAKFFNCYNSELRHQERGNVPLPNAQIDDGANRGSCRSRPAR